MKDPIEGIADERLFELSADLAIQLEKSAGTRPVLWLLSKQRAKAVVALFALAKVDPEKVDVIRALQNEVNLYDDLVESCRELMARGREADAAISDRDRDDINDLVTTPEDRQLYRIGNQGIDA